MDIMELMDDSFNAFAESDIKSFTVTPVLINTGTIARSYFPVIQEACQSQLTILQMTADYPSFNKAMQIQLALNRLDYLISLKEVISQPKVKTIVQKNHEEDICRLYDADFSNLETLLEFQSVLWWWLAEKEANELSIKTIAPNRYKVFYSLADALASTGMECGEYLLGIDPLFLNELKRESTMLQTVKQAIYTRLEGLDNISNESLPGQKLRKVG